MILVTSGAGFIRTQNILNPDDGNTRYFYKG